MQSKYLLAAIHALDSETVMIDQGTDDDLPLLTSTETGTLMLIMPIVWAKELTKQTDTARAPKLRSEREVRGGTAPDKHHIGSVHIGSHEGGISWMQEATSKVKART